MINTKYRQGYVSNSSSCSFTCCLTGETKEGWDYYEHPINSGVYECEECGRIFFPEAENEFNIRLYPNRQGYIKEKNCPFCNGSQVIKLILKPDETYTIIKKEE